MTYKSVSPSPPLLSPKPISRLKNHRTIRKLNRIANSKIVRLLLVFVILINIFLASIITFTNKKKILGVKLPRRKKSNKDAQQLYRLSRVRLATAPNHKQNYYQGGGGASYEDIPVIIEVPHDQISFINPASREYEQEQMKTQTMYNIPEGKKYEELNNKEKLQWMLREISEDKEKYWLAHTELTDYEIKLHVKDFLYENWIGKPVLFYDPRFTLSIYLSELRNQYKRKQMNKSKQGKQDDDKNNSNNNNDEDDDDDDPVVVPFAWSDWVDLTMLNQELVKPEKKRKTCAYMKATHHIPTKYPDYCIDNVDVVRQDLDEMQLQLVNYVPGFAVKTSPTNKASNEVRMLEGKSHLLTYAKNPMSIIFLSKDGVYEAQVDGKQRIVDGSLFDNYLKDNNIARDELEIITMNPVKEFVHLVEQVPPQMIKPEEDRYGMVATLKELNPSQSKEIYLPPLAFNYQQDKIDLQIKEYESRMKKAMGLVTNELTFDQEEIYKLRLTRKEKLYYDGLKYANKFPLKKEPTHFRMARLNFGNAENDHDAGWHYEWRFFNGALKYLKKGWTEDELQIRENVLLDRILRNWFKFANMKGVISWIAHGPLLSWYWDGLLFPFDEDIDIQMPASDLASFCKSYNQSLVVEEITEGFGKFFIECSSFVHHRGKSFKENHIDARFIDIDTGSYIDITGLGISDLPVPERYESLILQNEAEGVPRQVYNCRYPHFYSHDEISPLRYTMLGGIPVFVPNQIETILQQEYEQGLESYEYEGFFFVDALGLWIHHSKMEFLFPNEDLYAKKKGRKKVKSNSKNKKIKNANTNNLDIEKFTRLVKGITEEQVVKLLENDQDILLEYYLTRQATSIHKQELTHLFHMENGTNTAIGDISGMKTNREIMNDGEYHRLTSSFKFQKPFRRPLFNYEQIDRPRHHQG